MATAMSTRVFDLKHGKKLPNSGYLCISGKISESAKNHILDTASNPNLFFLDIDEIIPEIDDHFPEFWQGIGAERMPYLEALEEKLLYQNESLSALIKMSDADSPVSDKGFIQLRLSRSFMKPKTVLGKVTQEPDFEELTIDDILKRPFDRVLIVGGAGSGKSTILKRAAELQCRKAMTAQNAAIPVFFRAIEVVASSLSLAEDALGLSEKLSSNSVAAFTTADMQSGNVVFLIDALDEIGTNSLLDQFVVKLNDFTTYYPNCRVLMTSRNYRKIRKALVAFTAFNVAPLGLKDATKIISNFGKKKLVKERGAEVMRQLESIHGFELNPLVVTVFAATADLRRADIPCNITELFAKFTELMLGRWDTDKGIAQQYEAPLKALLLERIAFKMHSAKQVRMHIDEFRMFMEDQLRPLGHDEDAIDAFIAEILDRSSLIRDVEDHFEFSHLLIQEYYAGRAIKDETQLTAFARDEWWQRPIVFYFGSNPDNIDGLSKMCRTDIAPTSKELFALATTLGFAAQACYFVTEDDKSRIMDWVIGALAISTLDLLKDSPSSKRPIHDFLFAYLAARDSVGAQCVLNIHKTTARLPLAGSEADHLEEFWLIVGLMEAGHLAQALERVKRLKSKEPLTYLALHMGAYMIEHVRAGTKEKRTLAAGITDFVMPKAAPLFASALKEYKTALLELQRGEIKELTANSLAYE